MRLFNPCNKCIVKPMCKTACPPYKEYTDGWINKLKWLISQLLGELWEIIINLIRDKEYTLLVLITIFILDIIGFTLFKLIE